MSAPTLRVAELNRLDTKSFVSALGGIYESSPWVAQAVVEKRPFHSLAALQTALAAAVASSGADKQMALIKAHPELALKGSAAANLTDHSKREQATSGMSTLDQAEQTQFTRVSKQYRERHGFPFIVAVLTLDRDAIMRSLSERVFNTREEEIKRALAEIDKIAALRLRRLIVDESSSPSDPSIAPLGATRSSAGTYLADVQYGKSRVRVLKVLRDSPVHEVLEVEVQVLLRGALNPSFTRGDNALVVPTDTCKNTVLVLAKESFTGDLESFGSRIGSHFLSQYSHVSSVDVKMTQRVWERMMAATETTPGTFDGERKPHKHSFVHRGPEKPNTHVVSTRKGVWIESGITEFMVLKSTGSGFADFPRCALTLLPDTDERILATKISAHWSFNQVPSSGFRAANKKILDVMLDRFATRYSVSVQATMYEMALDALAACKEIDAIKITLPNVHFLLYNMSPFNLVNAHCVFIPTDEPHGTIELRLAREGKKFSAESKNASTQALGELLFPTAEPCAALPPRPRL